MARKKAHEDHVNHEAWAIPYGDLITLLLAFFVVMYAVSSVNEGQYRVLSLSLSEAFGGKPRTISPIQLGKTQVAGSRADRAPPSSSKAAGPVAPMPLTQWQLKPQIDRYRKGGGLDGGDAQISPALRARAQAQLKAISARVEAALADLIDLDLVTVNRSEFWVEVEIKSDLLFASGVAVPQPSAEPVLVKLADALVPFPNPLRIEGHTDNVPISTRAFPSNWELSAARAASVVHLFQRAGIAPSRMAVIGFGEQRPRADNTSPEGRDLNRRVVVVILSTMDEDGGPSAQPPEGASVGQNVPGKGIDNDNATAGTRESAGLPQRR